MVKVDLGKSTLDMIKLINKEDHKVAEAVKEDVENIAKAVDLIYGRLIRGGRLIYVGAGNSGRLGVLDACECPPTFGVEPGVVVGVLAGGRNATVYAQEGSEDFEELSIEELKKLGLNENDAVVALSASGRTPYAKGALKYAKEVGAAHIAVSCSRNAELSKFGEVAIEVVTGSTRLKAGTAQKMILNMLSTGSMIKSGKVYGNYMVDVRAGNHKLVERSKKIIVDCTGVSREEAEKYLEISEGKVKLAVFMILSQLNKEESIKVLEENDNTIYKALQAIK